MDDADYAQEREDLIRQRAIKALRSREPQVPQRSRSVHCEDCGERIPAKRLEARPNARRCVDCQVIDEHKRRQQQWK